MLNRHGLETLLKAYEVLLVHINLLICIEWLQTYTKTHFYDCKHPDHTFAVDNIALLATKNPRLPGICKFQPLFIRTFRVISTGPGTYNLDLPPSMVAVYPQFHSSLFKPAGPQPARLFALKDDSYEVEAIFQINKCIKYDKLKWICYDLSCNQWIKLLELREKSSWHCLDLHNGGEAKESLVWDLEREYER